MQIRSQITGSVLFETDSATLRGADMRDADMRGADMRGADMRGADMRGADMRDADMSDADISGAALRDADMRGAALRGAKIVRIVARAYRLDDYEFIGFDTNRGLIIRAGCRTMSPVEYRAHVATEYPDTPKAEETLAILDFIEARAAIAKANG